MIYLDNSATTFPKPPEVQAAVQQAMRFYGANPGRSGYPMSVQTTRKIYECRKLAADFFGASGPECVIFTPSCTQALNMVIKGYLKSGDHAVVSDLEHNAVMRPLAAMEKRGITYSVAHVYEDDNDATLNAFREAFNPRTKLVICTHGSNVFGIKLPVERIAALAHQYDVKVCVDGAQSAGVVPVDISDSGIDFFCAAGHKGLYGPMGTGILIFRDPNDMLDTIVEGGTGTYSRDLIQPQSPPERYESGTVNVPGIIGLGAGIRFVKNKGPANIWKNEMGKISYIYDGLSRIPGVKLYTKRHEMPGFLPVLSFNLEGYTCEQTGEYLAKNGIAVRSGLHCAPAAHDKMGTAEGTVRVSPSVFTTRQQADALISSVKAALRAKAVIKQKKS